MITSTRGSLQVNDDQNSMYHMKKYSRKGDRVDVKVAGREKNRLNGNLKETSLIKHMITVLTDEKANLTKMVVLNEI